MYLSVILTLQVGPMSLEKPGIPLDKVSKVCSYSLPVNLFYKFQSFPGNDLFSKKKTTNSYIIIIKI